MNFCYIHDVDLLAQELSEMEILRNYLGLTHEDIQACLR
ncbi:MAG: DUF433 domain-containing protein [bacterium]